MGGPSFISSAEDSRFRKGCSRLLTTYVSPAKWVLRRLDHSAMQVSGREP